MSGTERLQLVRVIQLPVEDIDLAVAVIELDCLRSPAIRQRSTTPGRTSRSPSRADPASPGTYPCEEPVDAGAGLKMCP